MNKALRFIYILWYLPVFYVLIGILSIAIFFVDFLSARAARYLCNTVVGHATLDPGGLRLKTLGRENLPAGSGFIIFANHSSLLDIPAVALSTGSSITWVAKAALGKIPFFGWALRKVHMLVDRGGGAEAARRMVEDAEDRLKKGQILAIFPEGTRNRGQALLQPFKKGAFILAKHTGAPLVPVAIKNAGRLWPPGHFWPRPGLIRVKIGPTLQPVPGERLADLTAKAQAALEALLADESW
ncbi:MAG: 1-acyl-sn-glycerol-3-phosphate acyltransferase [Candidatus Adiutrix sp.]|jgi:1-acyl-sn-glycerol-3-phosphate acyltransferase|nr:1-acyl-sn-glycerol-3-phosphate acyltransferase [Candidatus Adiutrix sp.]